MKRILQILFGTLILISFVLFYYFDLHTFLSKENINTTKQLMLDYFGVWLPLIILLFYVGFNFVGLPTMFFSILSGYLYNFQIALLIAWFGMTIGILCSFWNSKYLFKEAFMNKFGSNEKIATLEQSIDKHPFMTALLTRLFFIIPYNFQNYAYGCTNIKTLTYIPATALGILPITVLNVMLGKLLSTGDIRNAGISNVMAISSVILVFILLFIILKKKLSVKIFAKNADK